MTGTPEPTYRVPRSAELTLAQAVLGLEAIGVLFVASLLAGFANAGTVGTSRGTIWALAWVATGVFVVAAGLQGRPWGRPLGWILQLPLLAATPASPIIGAVSAMFVVLWVLSLRVGSRIDRERAEYNAAHDDGGDR